MDNDHFPAHQGHRNHHKQRKRGSQQASHWHRCPKKPEGAIWTRCLDPYSARWNPDSGLIADEHLPHATQDRKWTRAIAEHRETISTPFPLPVHPVRESEVSPDASSFLPSLLSSLFLGLENAVVPFLPSFLPSGSIEFAVSLFTIQVRLPCIGRVCQRIISLNRRTDQTHDEVDRDPA